MNDTLTFETTANVDMPRKIPNHIPVKNVVHRMHAYFVYTRIHKHIYLKHA